MGRHLAVDAEDTPTGGQVLHNLVSEDEAEAAVILSVACQNGRFPVITYHNHHTRWNQQNDQIYRCKREFVLF